jgi:mRNA-degrading endonuclease RelE of RelBE toxin-antitoxin system
MKLIELASDKWTIYAYVENNNNCPVLELLDDIDERLAAKMSTLLFDHLPVNGPVHNETFSKKLSNNTFEFKRGPKRGPGLRVLYFYDENNIIVCTSGFIKRDSADKSAIELNEAIRTVYFRDKANSNLEIDKLMD